MRDVLEERYGSYVLRVRYSEDGAYVSMYDLGELRFPLIWGTPMTKAQANGAIELFKNIGYFDMPL